MMSKLRILLVLIALTILIIGCCIIKLSNNTLVDNVPNVPIENAPIENITASVAQVIPTIDGTLSPTEWVDCKFYSYSWEKDVQNITNEQLVITIGFKYNSTHLFVAATVNDDDYNPWDMIGLIFDSNNNVSLIESDHLVLSASNGTYPLGHGFGVDSNGSLWFCYCIPVYIPEEPVNVTFTEKGYTFEAAFKLSRLNITESLRLDIVYIDRDSHTQVALVDTRLPEKYPNFVFEK